MKLGRKLIALVLATALTMTCFVGCAREAVIPDNEEVVMVINEQEVKMGLTNFFVRYQQSLVESMYVAYMGNGAWNQKTENGDTYEEDMKKALLTELQKMIITVQKAEAYEVSLTEAELAEIEKAADAFDKANSKEVKQLVSGEKENAIEFFKLLKLSDKVNEAIEAKEEKEADTIEKWVKEAKIELKEDVWAKVSLDGLSVLPVEKEEEAKEDDKETDDKASETTDDVADKATDDAKKDATDAATDESAK